MMFIQDKTGRYLLNVSKIVTAYFDERKGLYEVQMVGGDIHVLNRHEASKLMDMYWEEERARNEREDSRL